MAQTETGSSSSHCFVNLEPDSLYRISVRSVLGAAEGAAVSILHPTGLIPQISALLFSFCCLKLGTGYFLICSFKDLLKMYNIVEKSWM